MRHARSQRFGLAAGVALLSCAAQAVSPATSALEAHLRTLRPEVVRWQAQPVDSHARARQSGADLVRVGRIGPRTVVRFADGSVRWYAVSGFAPVLVSARAVEAGTALSASDTVLAERDVVALGCEPLKTFGDGIRLRATRRITSGEALCANAVEPAPQVERNQPVVLQARRGPISASRVLMATRDASTGERVRLRDSASGASVVAVVTGRGAARDPNSQEQQ